jgi:subtilisin family serine protease
MAALCAVAGCSDDAGIAGPTPVGAFSGAAVPNAAAVASPVAGEVIPDEYIVRLNDDAADVPGLARKLVTLHGGTLRFTYTTALRGFGARLPAQAAEALRRNPHVALVEPDRIVEGTDMQSAAPWNLDRVDQRALPLNGTFAYTGSGAGVNIYIIDSGIRTTHTDFGGRASGAWTGVNDGNGAGDCSGHGTMVAAAAGGARFGVAKQATLWSVRVLDCSGSGSLSTILAGVDWVTRNARRPAVANMSLGSGSYSTLTAAVANSIAAGVTYAVSAGNSATDACGQSPADVAPALTVGAVNSADIQASWSNFGACVDLYAPGVSVRTASAASDTSTTSASGTSFASPIVAGAAALVLEAKPTASPADVAQAVVSTATPGILSGLGSRSPNLLLHTASLQNAVLPVTRDTSSAVLLPPPTASFSITCSKGTCSADASTSTAGGAIATYAWTFGDASGTTTSDRPLAAHAYRAPGTYTVVLSVTDRSGLAAQARRSVTIRKI